MRVSTKMIYAFLIIPKSFIILLRKKVVGKWIGGYMDRLYVIWDFPSCPIKIDIYDNTGLFLLNHYQPQISEKCSKYVVISLQRWLNRLIVPKITLTYVHTTHAIYITSIFPLFQFIQTPKPPRPLKKRNWKLQIF